MPTKYLKCGAILELDFKFYIIFINLDLYLNSYMWLVAPILGSEVRNIQL